MTARIVVIREDRRTVVRVAGARGADGAPGAPGAPGADGAPGTTEWSGITGKPATFPPDAHTHDYEASGAAAAAVVAHESADSHSIYGIANPDVGALVWNVGGTTTVALDGGRTEKFTATATGNTTLAFSGFPASGKVSRFELAITNLGNYTTTLPAGWVIADTPTLTPSKTQVLIGETSDAGATGRLYLIDEI